MFLFEVAVAKFFDGFAKVISWVLTSLVSRLGAVERDGRCREIHGLVIDDSG